MLRLFELGGKLRRQLRGRQIMGEMRQIAIIAVHQIKQRAVVDIIMPIGVGIFGARRIDAESLFHRVNLRAASRQAGQGWMKIG